MNASEDHGPGLELRSKLTSAGRMELTLQAAVARTPEAGEVIVRVEAAPVNPTDISLLMGPAKPSEAKVSGHADSLKVSLPVAPAALRALASRQDISICPGLEGAGTVIAAGEGAEHLVGRTVAVFGGGMFATHRLAKAGECLVFPKGKPASSCASAFVNPLTTLAMIDTIRRDGHRALVHTAAASNLGQMLVKLCREEDIPLVNIVRSDEQADILRGIGARYVLNSASAVFLDELTEAIRDTRATAAFDAIGGGMLAYNIIRAMETVFAPPSFEMYGSTVLKQVYAYGVLDPAPIQIARGAGMAWSVSGWLMMNHLARLDADVVEAMRARVVRDIDTTFASHFSDEVALGALLDPGTLQAMAGRATGRKYLVNPSLHAGQPIGHAG
jgi:NADPH:quinone reductase-like Zn-dependent oxidoreductase